MSPRRQLGRGILPRTQAPAWARNSAKLRFAGTARRAAKREAELREIACPSRAWARSDERARLSQATPDVRYNADMKDVAIIALALIVYLVALTWIAAALLAL